MVFFINFKMDLFILLVGLLTLISYLLKRTHSYWDRKGFKTLPDFNYLMGHIDLDFTLTPFVNRIAKIYTATSDPFSCIYLFFKPKLFVRDPELIRSILIKDFSYFTDREFPCDEEHEPLSGNLFGLPGPRWRKLRAKLTPAFTSGKLKEMVPTLVECGSTLQNHLDKLADKNEFLDAKETSASHATNVVASVAFGIEVDTINDPNNAFRVCGRSITEPCLRKAIVFFAPKIANLFRLRFDDISIEHFIMSMVKQNLENRETNNIVRKDFFQLLIQLRNSGSVQLDDEWNTNFKSIESEKMMTLEEMAAQVFIFFLAGFETTSSTLTFCLYELAKNQEIQQRVHDEIDAVLSQHDGQITYESLSEMKFLEYCILETLRMYPILPTLTRRCVQDYRIPGTNKIIEKGIEVIIPVYTLQRDAKYYDEPNKFNPERFNDENPAGKDQLNHPYLPFGDGPRNCAQTKVGIVQMLQKFTFELEDELKSRDIELDPKVFLLTPNGKLNIKVLKR